MLTLNQRNIKATYELANANDIEQGMKWYKQAHDICKQLAEAYGVPLFRVCAVMAVLSPRCKWEKNVELTELALSKHRIGVDLSTLPCLKVNARKANEILDGADPIAVIGGYKVTNFNHNIFYPWGAEAVTVDTHAISIWNGSRCKDKETAPIFSSIKKYNAIAEDYRVVAAEVGILPCELQAITWVAYKRINNI